MKPNRMPVLMFFCFLLHKDFASTIPGHGGIMDRFDCQYLMATFVHVYIASFIRWAHRPTIRDLLTKMDKWTTCFVLVCAEVQIPAKSCSSCWCFSPSSSSVSSSLYTVSSKKEACYPLQTESGTGGLAVSLSAWVWKAEYVCLCVTDD